MFEQITHIVCSTLSVKKSWRKQIAPSQRWQEEAATMKDDLEPKDLNIFGDDHFLLNLLLVDNFIFVGRRELPLWTYLLRKVNRRIMRGAALAKFAIDNACQVMGAM